MKEREKERESTQSRWGFQINLFKIFYIYKKLKKNNTTQTHLKLYDLLLFAKL